MSGPVTSGLAATSVTDPDGRECGSEGCAAAVATSPAAWWCALGVVLVTLVYRVPVLQAYVERMLTRHPEITVDLHDPHVRSVAVNLGLAMAVVIQLGLLFVYQSLGRALERHVFRPSIRVGRARFGLFFTVSAAATVPLHVLGAVLGRVTVRGSGWYYVAVLVASAGAVLLFRPRLLHLGRARYVALSACTIGYGLMATLI
jgi:hypothetical protein